MFELDIELLTKTQQNMFWMFYLNEPIQTKRKYSSHKRLADFWIGGHRNNCPLPLFLFHILPLLCCLYPCFAFTRDAGWGLHTSFWAFLVTQGRYFFQASLFHTFVIFWTLYLWIFPLWEGTICSRYLYGNMFEQTSVIPFL